MNIIKFGGKSLANGNGLESVIDIIKQKHSSAEAFHIVVSARGNATDQLLELAKLAIQGKPYTTPFYNFKKEQEQPLSSPLLHTEFERIENILNGIELLKDFSKSTEAELLAQGELISAKTIVELLKHEKINGHVVDSRLILKTESVDGKTKVKHGISEQNTIAYVRNHIQDSIGVFTGFIASDHANKTTTLGRNGSNYSAALFANYLHANKVENYTHVDGIFSANPEWVSRAKIISNLSFQEANELANFGTSILHQKTILPLIDKKIPFQIKNTFKPNNSGTLISNEVVKDGIKAISVQNNIGLIEVHGNGFWGKAGVDARIFNALAKAEVSVGMVSQGSSERGISFLVEENQVDNAKTALEQEFYYEIKSNEVDSIKTDKQIGLISIVGHGIEYFHKPFQALIKNQIKPLLINNTLNGKNIGLVVKNQDIKKAVNVVHGQIFGENKVVNLAVIGKGTVGSVFLDQVIENAEKLKTRKQIDLNIFALSGQDALLLNAEGLDTNWKERIELKSQKHETSLPKQIANYANANHLENLILVDNTASSDFAKTYPEFVEQGFNLVSSNKISNTLDIKSYQDLRALLHTSRKKYLYETNVGAGLPLIDTIRLLHDSGENITKIRGVFSGSLSYLFNEFSVRDEAFHVVLKEAIDKGFTEPDPREDLCGNDVARKLLILARELDLENEFEDVSIENLIPELFRDLSKDEFLNRLEELNPTFSNIKAQQKENHVLRYVGELSGDLQQSKAELDVKLVSVPESSPLGQVKGSDSIFEIFTESYGDHPLVIQGAGAGAKVTARGVLGDVLRLAETL